MRYIFPPRPTLKIHPRFLPDYDGTWIAQRKYNGQRNLIHVLEDGKIEFWGRHGKQHSEYCIPSFLRQEISDLSLDKGCEYWIDSELLHSKTSAIKDTIVIYDVLFAKKYLFGVTQLDRLKLMNKLCGVLDSGETSYLGIQVSESVFVAKSFTNNFCDLFSQALDVPELEGLVLRNPNSKLDNFGQKEYEVSWMIRCRKEHKNYSF